MVKVVKMTSMMTIGFVNDAEWRKKRVTLHWLDDVLGKEYVADHFTFVISNVCNVSWSWSWIWGLIPVTTGNSWGNLKLNPRQWNVELARSDFLFYKTYFFHLFPLRADQWPCNVFVSIVASLVYGLSIAVTSSLPSPHHVVYSQNKDNKYFQSICSEIFMRMQKSQIA